MYRQKCRYHAAGCAFFAGPLFAVAFLAALSTAAKADEGNKAGALERNLANAQCQLIVLLPDEQKGYYRGRRFDWSGLIYAAVYQGHKYFGPWKETHDPLNHDDTAGPVEEFGMQVPLGYAEAKPGQPFIKIGVGLLEKIDEPEYRFWYPYKIIKPGSWQTTWGDDWIEFRQELSNGSQWGYQYVKRISLLPGEPGFVIDHRLRNTGTRPFTTNHYCHNFTRIDGYSIGPVYELTLPFAARPKDARGLKEVAAFKGQKLVFSREIKEGQDLFAELQGLGGGVADNEFRIENTRTGAGIRMVGDRALLKYNLYAARLALCPEPFIEFKLAPNEKVRWASRYTLYAKPYNGSH
jgi:hypothetical protein